MRRFLAIVLFAVLPLQFSWAAVASHCGLETQVGAEHFGHHDPQHHADPGADDGLDVDAASTLDAGDGEAPGAADLDCGDCHGACSMLLNLPWALPGAVSVAPPCAFPEEAGGALAPTRPEHPRWVPFA